MIRLESSEKASKRVSVFIVYLLANLLLAYSLAFASGKSDVGTSGAVFLKIGPGARPVGMGEAFTGVADDVHAIYWNPAGLGMLKKPELTGMHMQWFQDVQYEYAAFAYPTHDLGTWGMAISNLHTGHIDRRTEDTDTAVGQFDSNDLAYTLSYGLAVTSRLSLGFNGKYIRQTLDSIDASAYAADGGVLYDVDWRHLRLGASLQNAGSKVKFVNESDPLPLTMRFGASLRPFRAPLLLASDVIVPRDHQMGLAVGGEYDYRFRNGIRLIARSGYRSDSDVNGLSGVAAGGGIQLGRVRFDFAWVPFGELGNTYRYALHVLFGPRRGAGAEADQPEQRLSIQP